MDLQVIERYVAEADDTGRIHRFVAQASVCVYLEHRRFIGRFRTGAQKTALEDGNEHRVAFLLGLLAPSDEVREFLRHVPLTSH